MFKLLSIDNKTSHGNNLVGKVSPFKYDGFRFSFGDDKSGAVVSIIKKDELMEVKTINSLYIFEEV